MENNKMGTVFPPTLRRGSNGTDVQRLQDDLSKLGYKVGTINGVFSLTTEEAVIQFQKDHSLTVNGVVGPETGRFLGSIIRKSA
jgi:peptidoglycan hydrolase-like protein with peptidoglycan-binding domain